jgi:predicted amino acid dehydrogenase
MGVRALRQAAARSGIDLSRARLGVVGLPGNIATTYAQLMAPLVGELVLVGRSPASHRLQTVVDLLRRANPQTTVEVGDSPAALEGCSLIVTATVGAPDLIQPVHLGAGPIVICDMSVPSDVASSVQVERPDATVIPGGIVRLGGNDDFGLRGVALPPGHTFACLAETLLMGLEGITSHLSYGAITAHGVDRAMALADKHGFGLGDIDDTSRARQERPGP